MNFKITFLLQTFCLLTIISPAKPNDVFTSIEQLRGLSRLETFLTQLLDQYVKSRGFIPSVVLNFSEEMKIIIKERQAQGIDKYMNHPSNVFLLVRRFLKHWSELSRYLDEGPAGDLQGILKENKEVFPEPSDLLGCATALLRIQEVYHLSAKDMADGFLTKDVQGPKLGADECFELGYVTHKWTYFDQARDWLKETLLRMGTEYDYKGALDRLKVLEYLGWAEYQMGNLTGAIEHTEIILEKEPENHKAKQALKSYLQQQKYRSTYANNIDERMKASHRQNQKDKNTITYERLCRGEVIHEQPTEVLRCYYKYDHPLLRLKPAKIEVVSIEPEIQILHDAINDEEIEDITKRAKPKLYRASVTNTTTGEHVHAEYRTSRSAWLEENESTFLESLHARLEALTGLLVGDENAEYIQIVNYCVGGHYVAHHDYIGVSEHPSLDEGKGDRIATVLFYLSDVIAGGATVFIEPEIVVYPKKGDAIFWNNLYKNGQPDTRTKHGACPVIIGSKWVANKWILEKGQDARRPCGLNEDD